MSPAPSWLTCLWHEQQLRSRRGNQRDCLASFFMLTGGRKGRGERKETMRYQKSAIHREDIVISRSSVTVSHQQLKLLPLSSSCRRPHDHRTVSPSRTCLISSLLLFLGCWLETNFSPSFHDELVTQPTVTVTLSLLFGGPLLPRPWHLLRSVKSYICIKARGMLLSSSSSALSSHNHWAGDTRDIYVYE